MTEQIKFELMRRYINEHNDSSSGIKNKVVYSITISTNTQLDKIHRKRESLRILRITLELCVLLYTLLSRHNEDSDFGVLIDEFSQIFIIK